MTGAIYAAKPWLGLLSEARRAPVDQPTVLVEYPREVGILPELPKTASGKILRWELRSPSAASP